MSFEIGDTVVYGAQGICRIEDIAERDFLGISLLYYILKPAYDDKSTYYVPVHNPVSTGKLRHIMSSKEIYALIKAMPDENLFQISDKNERREKYNSIIVSGDRKELVKLIKTIYVCWQQRVAEGKKPIAEEERIMKIAEKVLYEEFAHVLNITPEQVPLFISEQIEMNEKRYVG